MINLLKAFVGVFLLKVKPQDLPATQSALQIAAVAAFITEMASLFGQIPLSVNVLVSLSKLALFGGVLYLILKLHQKSERWTQTLTAILGSLSVVNLLTLPFLPKLIEFMANMKTTKDGTLPEVALSPALILVFVLQLWFFVVLVRILKEAMEISTARAVINSLMIVYLVSLILGSIVSQFPSVSPLPVPTQ